MKYKHIIYFVFMSIFFYGFTFGKYEINSESAMMCGPNTLWLAARSCGIKTTLKKLRYFADTSKERGTSVEGMLKALQSLGIDPVLVKTDWKGLMKIKVPVIVMLKGDNIGHYVFLEKTNKKEALIIDPPKRLKLSKNDFEEKFTGYAIVPSKSSLDLKFSSIIPNYVKVFFIILLLIIAVCFFLKGKKNKQFIKILL